VLNSGDDQQFMAPPIPEVKDRNDVIKKPTIIFSEGTESIVKRKSTNSSRMQPQSLPDNKLNRGISQYQP